MNSISLHVPLLLAQTGEAVQNSREETIRDETGKVDVSTASVWETVDNMVDTVVTRLPHLAIAAVVLVIFYFLSRGLRAFIKSTTKDRESANLGMVVGRLAQWVTLFVGLLVAVAIVAPTVTPGKLLAGLGVGGVAIGFAFKDILQNFMAGLLILIREPFCVGDQIVSGDYEGTVKSIETRATFIRTYDGRRVIIPNSQIYTNPVVVNTAFDSQRTQYDIGIGYGDDLRQAVEVILDVVRSTEGVLSDPAPDVLIVALAGSSINLRARWWSKSDRASVVHIGSEVVARIKGALDEADIDMPYPTRVVLWHDQTEATDGDRTKQREGWPAGESPPEPARLAAAIQQANADS